MISPTIQTEIKKFYMAQPDFGNLPMQELDRLSEATRFKRVHLGTRILMFRGMSLVTCIS